MLRIWSGTASVTRRGRMMAMDLRSAERGTVGTAAIWVLEFADSLSLEHGPDATLIPDL
jgi:hypothetical protein